MYLHTLPVRDDVEPNNFVGRLHVNARENPLHQFASTRNSSPDMEGPTRRLSFRFSLQIRGDQASNQLKSANYSKASALPERSLNLIIPNHV